MNLISPWNLRFPPISIPPITAFPHCKPSLTNQSFSFPFWPHPCRIISTTSFLVHAKKRNSKPEPVLEPTIIEQVSGDDEDKEEQLLFDDFEDGNLNLNNPFSLFCSVLKASFKVFIFDFRSSDGW
jgi:hypothetical protein